MELGLKGKRAVVLASSRGLGYACALGLAREGCDLVITSRSQDHVDAAAARIREETGARVVAVAADVSSEEGVRLPVQRCIEEFGGVDIAVHNAGGPPPGNFGAVKSEQWYKAFDQNLMSFVWLVQAVRPSMETNGWGRIIAITAISIKQPIPTLVLSNAMRTAVLGTVRTLVKEVTPKGINVNVVAPGRISTERIEELDQATAARTGKSIEQVRKESLATIPAGRLGDPQEFANMVVFLASEAASYVNGAVVQVDGGMLDALQ
ncbi:MAG: SDR family oxidoreductase [Caldilineaceae bacterium]|nr:SDR family oxidoreductase [Caldilineaceae bacterium]